MVLLEVERREDDDGVGVTLPISLSIIMLRLSASIVRFVSFINW